MVGGRVLISTRKYVNGQVEEVFRWRSQYGTLSFDLNGFWSAITAMVGRVAEIWRQPNMPDLDVVLKLNGVKRPFTITSLINGTLERLNPTKDHSNYSHEQLSTLMTPLNHMDYNYTLVSEKNNIDHVCDGGNATIPENTCSSRLELDNICSMLILGSYISFEYNYSSDCK